MIVCSIDCLCYDCDIKDCNHCIICCQLDNNRDYCIRQCDKKEQDIQRKKIINVLSKDT